MMNSESAKSPADGHPEAHSAAEMGPVLAGAYARGMADLLHLLGLPALLLDRNGLILHVNAHVPSLMGAGLGVAQARLVIADPEAARLYRDCLNRPGQGAGRRTIPISRADDSGLKLHFVPIPEDSSGFQLARAVVLLDDGHAAAGLGCVNALIAGAVSAAEAQKARH